jgi:hypothetical protein
MDVGILHAGSSSKNPRTASNVQVCFRFVFKATTSPKNDHAKTGNAKKICLSLQCPIVLHPPVESNRQPAARMRRMRVAVTLSTQQLLLPEKEHLPVWHGLLVKPCVAKRGSTIPRFDKQTVPHLS